MTIHGLSERTGRYLAEKAGKPEQLPVLTYGLELIIGETIKLLLLVLIAYVLNLLLPMLFVFCTSIPLRVLTGGQHCSSSLRCLIVSLMAYIALGYLAVYLLSIMSPVNLLITAFLASIVMAATLDKFGPGYSVNYSSSSSKPTKTVTKLSFLFLAVWLVTILGVNITVGNQALSSTIIISTALGIYWQALMITPWGHKIINTADKGLCLLKIR
ncbi:accessory gene regulator ArgB-like protein [Phosphitispora fastidiosa]|uniref:accessory gene regulator ArgB-like protein n=1 Tax=Phosphitispora fastidiosa TaxID=2837202 RepID=UPI001E4298EF|nr:accessory gene regulator B family protein [Phosphitispora fastidiosa]MBU7007272.1 accessory gene regulator B [Phosphitispora fastidiosa]